MEEKNQEIKWLYSNTGKSFRGFLCMLTFCAWIAGVVFSMMGIKIYGRDILELDQNDYFESSVYQTDMLTAAGNVLENIHEAYIKNEGFDSNFSITDVAKDTIYYYDMKEILEDYKEKEFEITKLSDLDPYLWGVCRAANMYGFTDYNKVSDYLATPKAENNYIYFSEEAFKNLFKETGKINTNHRFSDRFSESAYFLFEGEEYANVDAVDIKKEIEESVTKEVTESEAPTSEEVVMTDSVEERDSYDSTFNYAVYDPIENLFYSPSDDYFNSMDSYIYDAEEIKRQMDEAEFESESDNTVFLWLRGYNYQVKNIWDNIIYKYKEVSENLRSLDQMHNNGSFVFYLANSDFICTNVKDINDIKNLKKVYGVKGRNSKEVFGENVEDPTKLADFPTLVGTIFDYQLPHNTMFYFGIDPERTHLKPDRVTWNYKYYTLFSKTVGLVVWLSVILALLLIVQAISLIKTTGRKDKNGKEVMLNFFDKLPTEIWAMITIILLGASAFFVIIARDYISFWSKWTKVGYLVSAGVMAVLPFGFLFMMLTLSFARRIKAHNLWNRLFLRKMVRSIILKTEAFWNTRKSSEKIMFLLIANVVVGMACMFILSGIILSRGRRIGLAVFLFAQAVTIYVVYHWARDLNTIEDGVSEITKGNLDYKCEIKRKRSLLKGLAEGVNHIGDGLKVAVETSVKNERMKTELITNVSHDLKTPLTSIINYVNLLKTEKMPTKEAEHYLEVLEKKSQRLRHLTEDLVEAAKANTGNIELEKMPLAFDELMKQAIGEFEDKFSERDLVIVTSYPEEPVVVMADGRRMFRIIENVLQNVYKYALEGTRVYADLSKEESEVTFTLKNISAAPLNISADELMERFKRGDSARTTEGSGLGLSIAKDLTKLQDGSFDIQLDGDLFKVIITFPVYVKPGEEE